MGFSREKRRNFSYYAVKRYDRWDPISIEKDIVDLTRRRYDLIEHDRRRESESREREEKFAGVKKLSTCRDTPLARGDAIVTHGNVSVDVRKYR